jgi:hypothetical protein
MTRGGSKQRLLLKVERVARVHYRFVFLVALLCLVTAIWLGRKLELESDMLNRSTRSGRRCGTSDPSTTS